MRTNRPLIIVALATFPLSLGACAADDDASDPADVVQVSSDALSTSCSTWHDYPLAGRISSGELSSIATFHERTCLTKVGKTAKAYIDYTIYASPYPDFSRFDIKVELQRRKTKIGLDVVIDSVVCHVTSRANDAARTGRSESGTCALPEVDASGGFYSSDGVVSADWDQPTHKNLSDSANLLGSPLVEFR